MSYLVSRVYKLPCVPLLGFLLSCISNLLDHIWDTLSLSSCNWNNDWGESLSWSTHERSGFHYEEPTGRNLWVKEGYKEGAVSTPHWKNKCSCDDKAVGKSESDTEIHHSRWWVWWGQWCTKQRYGQYPKGVHSVNQGWNLPGDHLWLDYPTRHKQVDKIGYPDTEWIKTPVLPPAMASILPKETVKEDQHTCYSEPKEMDNFKHNTRAANFDPMKWYWLGILTGPLWCEWHLVIFQDTLDHRVPTYKPKERKACIVTLMCFVLKDKESSLEEVPLNSFFYRSYKP